MTKMDCLLVWSFFIVFSFGGYAQRGVGEQGHALPGDLRHSSEWQWSMPVKGGKGNPDATAWLWIPSSCKKIRAVVIAQNNMEELSILENLSFRLALGRMDVAEVWVSPAFDHSFRWTEGAGDVFNRMMKDLAETSGYPELVYSPVIGIGHSAAASWPYYFAAWAPERTLACISVSGQWPYFRHPQFAPEIWAPGQQIDYIPSLETMGEYEAAASWSTEGLKERRDHPAMPLSMLACPAEGHFAATQEKIDYIALYIKKAIEYRLPDYDPMEGPPKLRRVDPTRTGWLMGKWRGEQGKRGVGVFGGDSAPVSAPVGKYKGDTAEAFWFFDEEMVRATERYESEWRDRRAPLLGYVQEGGVVRQRDTHLQVDLKWLPLTDGVSFVLKGAYLDTVPGESPRPAMWTGMPAGSRVGHPGETGMGDRGRTGTAMGHWARTGGIRIDRVAGPFRKINDTLFRLALDKEASSTSKGRYTLTFIATSAGTADYKPAAQQAQLLVPVADTEGIEQHINFPPITDQPVGVASLKLNASSDRGLPVSYYILEGPAEVNGDRLSFTKIPPRSRYPVKVTVVAWQYGNTGVRSARQVQRTFFIGNKEKVVVPVQKVIDLAQQQYEGYIKTHSDSLRYPRSTRADGSLGETAAADWTSGFFPGSLWALYRFTGKDQWKSAAQKWTGGLESQKNNKGTHDLGFMLYDSYGAGYSITKEAAYKAVLLQGASSLATRYHPEVGAIRSWDNPDFHYPVIIDNLMNLELLFWATGVSGDSSFYKIAVAHANTDLEYRWRPDGSSYHVLDFDPSTGKLLRRMTHQGYSDSSCWARGQAWGIYGYTVLYRETGDKRYLERAVGAADYFIEQTDKIADHIPNWDFQAPADAPKDASAAAVAASGMIELSRYAGAKYFDKAEEMLRSLCSEAYLAQPGTNNYFLLKHSTGHKPHNSEIDVPIVYADYYFLEALWRYREAMRTTVSSPDGNLRMMVSQKQGTDGKKAMYYTVAFKGQPVILESMLDIRMDNHVMESALALKPDTAADWCADLEYMGAETTSRDTTWKPVYGENSTIRDHYNEVTMNFAKAGRPGYTMQLVCRAYNEGVAFRYYFPENPTGVYYHITAEHTAFSLPAETRAWFTSWAQGPYRLLPLKDWPDESERPLVLQLPGGIYACLAEAQMTDYARTKFRLNKEKPNTIETALFGAVDGITYFGTPWRVVLVGEQAGDIIRNKDVLLNLNPPALLTNTDWIRPGKIMRDMTLSTEGAKEAIDFAAARHLQYILFDWKWYGPAMTFNTDATTVVAPIDMAEVVEYGKKKGIGIWLYVNQQSLLKQLDTILPLYEKWGIKGIKFGFVELGSQRWTVWLEEAIQKAAAYHLMVDVHDEWRPTGEQRTWPNLLSAEGVRGNEEMPDATHNTVLPFTRYIAGPADYTICYYDPRIKTTHAHQLALAAVYYSPLLTLFWYDKPEAYHNEPEVEFFEKIPTQWEETKVLDGRPGEFVAIGRRAGEDWFVGVITNDSARKAVIRFDFLPKNRKYKATIYSDDPSVQTATHVRRQQVTVDETSVMNIDLLPSGGQAMWLTPIK